MSDNYSSDIVIAGAGPAGITAALALAKRNVSCILLDKEIFPRNKTCGDGIGGKVLKTLEKIDAGIVERLALQEYVAGSWGVKFFSPGMKSVKIGFSSDKVNSPPGFICRRSHFDQFLLEDAKKYDEIIFHEGIEIVRIKVAADRLILTGKYGDVSYDCRLLLLANGDDASLQSQLGLEIPMNRPDGLGIRTYFSGVKDCDPDGAVEIHFLEELLPWYLWIFPFGNGVVNAGLAMLRPQIREKRIILKDLFEEIVNKYPGLKERFSGAVRESQWEAHRIPFFTGTRKLSGDHFMLLGDAAQLVDPFTGEGIGNAVLSGYIAAEVACQCLEKGDLSGDATRNYDEEVYRRMGKDLRLGLKLQNKARNGRLLDLVIGKAAVNEEVRNLLTDMLYNMNSKRRLGKPLFYLKLLVNK
jgi:geranylgeranyl reductase family protein